MLLIYCLPLATCCDFVKCPLWQFKTSSNETFLKVLLLADFMHSNSLLNNSFLRPCQPEPIHHKPSYLLAFVHENSSSVSGANSAPPSNEHSAPRGLFFSCCSRRFLMAHDWIPWGPLRTWFAPVTFMAFFTFRACSTISTLNKTKLARVPTLLLMR